MYELLLSPMKIGSMTVKNRTVMTAAEFSLGQTNGKPTERLMDYYEERARGGVGMIIPGICRVNDMGGVSTFTQLAMSHDYHIEPMRDFAERIHRHGARLCIQLHHPGRQGMASAINSLPLVIPVADRFPGVMDQVFKCTPLLLGLEAKGVCFSVQAPSKVELARHGATRMHAMSKKEIHSGRLRPTVWCSPWACARRGIWRGSWTSSACGASTGWATPFRAAPSPTPATAPMIL